MLLNRIGELLATIVPEQGSLARTGDQEFSFFDFANSPRNEALEYLQRIERVLELPLQLDQQYFYLDHSVGISAAPQDGTDAITLLGRAGTALAAAQRHGHEHFKFFHQELDSTVRQRLSLEAELRRALEREEFTLFYQPKLNLKTLTLGGAEALVRWQHPERGLLSPFHFIELAEETGLIEALGTWILQTACQQARAWQDQGIDIPRLAINISALQFRSGKLGQLVADTLTHHALSAERVELELTESLLMPEQGDDNHFVMQALQQFRELGVHISIDDFGTGYSSLSYLRRFPVDSLKIDRSFITGIPDNQSDANITRAIINLAHNLGLGVVAEGVETQAHQDFLASMNCDQVQGYWFSRPLPAVEFVKWVIDLAH